jgi:hypothetical protein
MSRDYKTVCHASLVASGRLSNDSSNSLSSKNDLGCIQHTAQHTVQPTRHEQVMELYKAELLKDTSLSTRKRSTINIKYCWMLQHSIPGELTPIQ